MKKYICTSDIFDITDGKKRMDMFNYCHRHALNLGLICQSHLDGKDTILYMTGSKSKFIKYYAMTLFQSENILDGIKRIISIIFT